MDAEVTLGGGAVVAHLTSVWFVSTCVGLAPGQARVLLTSDAVDALRGALRVFVLHMNLESLLVLVVPVTLGTLECLGWVVDEVFT